MHYMYVPLALSVKLVILGLVNMLKAGERIEDGTQKVTGLYIWDNNKTVKPTTCLVAGKEYLKRLVKVIYGSVMLRN